VVRVGSKAGLSAGMKVTLGFRPEHLVMEEGPLRVTISVVEPTGPETQVSGRLGDGIVRFITKDRPDLSPGDTVVLNVPEERLHLFHRESGQRL
jgi:multiple sugar transport system ATP-binding protein